MKHIIIIIIPALIILFTCPASAQNLDIELLCRINGPPKAADGSWKFISNTSAYIDIAVPVTMFIAGISSQNRALKHKSYVAAASLLSTIALTEIIKNSVMRPRPYTTYPDLIVKKGYGGGYSFPSGHTSSAFATATSLSLAFPKWYVIVPSFLYASAVAYSRMYLGVHYPCDVLGGIITGAGSSLLVYEISRWMNRNRNRCIMH